LAKIRGKRKPFLYWEDKILGVLACQKKKRKNKGSPERTGGTSTEGICSSGTPRVKTRKGREGEAAIGGRKKKSTVT